MSTIIYFLLIYVFLVGLFDVLGWVITLPKKIYTWIKDTFFPNKN